MVAVRRGFRRSLGFVALATVLVSFWFRYRGPEGRRTAPARLAALVDCAQRSKLFECSFYAAAAEMAVEESSHLVVTDEADGVRISGAIKSAAELGRDG